VRAEGVFKGVGDVALGLRVARVHAWRYTRMKWVQYEAIRVWCSIFVRPDFTCQCIVHQLITGRLTSPEDVSTIK